MNRKRMAVIVGAVATAAVLAFGGYRLYEALDARGKRPTFSAEWQRCEAGDTCVAVAAPCQDWEAVNERYHDDAAAYYNHLMAVIESSELWCPSRSIPTMTPFAMCLSGQCAITGR